MSVVTGGLLFDPDDDGALVTWAEDVFVARLGERIGGERRDGMLEVQYRAEVLDTLKGDVAGSVVINVLPLSDTVVREDTDPLDAGQTYLFSTRPRPGRPWQSVSLPQAAVPVADAAERERLVARFSTAIAAAG